MKTRRRLLTVTFFTAAMFGGMPAFAADSPAAAPTVAAKPAVGRTRLPEEMPYQKTLRAYLGSLTEKDFDHGIAVQSLKVTPVAEDDDAFRTWLLSLEVPRVGRKRSYPSVNLPTVQFTLDSIENQERGVIRPACWPEPTAWLANWKYEGNPYYNSRALKLRAFVTASVLMLMADDVQLHPTGPQHTRTDWFASHLVAVAYTYLAVKDVIPVDAREAYETCLRGMMKRVNQWGPRGDETHFDVACVLGMRLAGDAAGDPASKKLAEDYARRCFANDQFYNNAGYFPDQGCFEAGFLGMSLYWGTWLGLVANDWPFVQDAVKKTIKLRSYLLLPEPDGALVGPSHFNSRTGSDVLKDQWDWQHRFAAQALLTDDGLCQMNSPADVVIKQAPKAAISELGAQITETPGYVTNDRLRSHIWRWGVWPNSAQFPMNNFAFDYYPKGYAAHRAELIKKNSPLLKYPFQRDGNFTETFGKVFLFAKRANFGVIVHTGPVSEFQGEGHQELNGPYGLSGGTLSSFWTPATGSVLLGRRSGMRISGADAITYDKPEAWRTWPVHAVSGTTAAGKFFTSARIQKPDATYDVQGKNTAVKVTGTIPAVTIGTEKALDGKIDYARTFSVDDKGLSVETSVTGDGKDQVTELYEVFPVFLRDAERQGKALPTTIEFEFGGKWVSATSEYLADVRAVRLTRFEGAVEIRFDRPRRVKLSPADWADAYLSRAICRNVLVDLLENNDQPTTVKEAKKIGYRIEAVKKP